MRVTIGNFDFSVKPKIDQDGINHWEAFHSGQFIVSGDTIEEIMNELVHFANNEIT